MPQSEAVTKMAFGWVSVSIVVLILLVLFWLVYFYVRRRRRPKMIDKKAGDEGGD
jgi:uncharacterized BrkB/YihY/UPF0761 family membrane protein